ncbi:MAG: plastocyanin/azurin family copper-binding protein [Pseudomonadota bacterium]
MNDSKLTSRVVNVFNRAAHSSVLFIFLLLQQPVLAEERTFVVEMITDNGKKLFVPDYIEVSIGDTVRFVNVSGKHNTESMRSMIPEGATPWRSKLGKQFDLKITHEGVYAFRCTPHYRQAMVGLIVAGNPGTNLERAKRVFTPPKVAEVFDHLFAKAAQRTK